MDPKEFHLSTETWINILYELAATFHAWTHHRKRLLDLVTPLYFARVASFVRQTRDMTTLEAEQLVEEQAQRFEDRKDYLIQVWDQKTREMEKPLPGIR